MNTKFHNFVISIKGFCLYRFPCTTPPWELNFIIGIKDNDDFMFFYARFICNKVKFLAEVKSRFCQVFRYLSIEAQEISYLAAWSQLSYLFMLSKYSLFTC